MLYTVYIYIYIIALLEKFTMHACCLKCEAMSIKVAVSRDFYILFLTEFANVGFFWNY